MNSADLVTRLRDIYENWGLSSKGPSYLREAADRVEALEARLAEAMEVLRPFAKAVEGAEAAARNMMCDHQTEVDGERMFGPLGIRWKHLRAARRLVEKEDRR